MLIACMCLDHCNSFSRYHAIMAEKRETKKSEDKRFSILATCQSGILAMLSSKIIGPAAHGST